MTQVLTIKKLEENEILIYGNAIKIATVVFAVAVGLLAVACSDDEESNYTKEE